jgi:hypothetical protein
MMFPGTASARPGQLRKLGSVTLTRVSAPWASVSTQCRQGPRHPSTQLGRRRRSQRGVGERPQGLRENAQRLLDLPRPHHQASADVAALLHRHIEAQRLVGVVRVVTAQVLVEARGSRREPGDAEVPGRLRGEGPRAVDPVGEAARVDEQGHERLEVGFQAVEVTDELVTACGGEVRLHPADGHGPSQEARAEEPLLERDEPLAQELGVRGRDGEGHVGGDGPDVRDVVVDTLQLEQNDAQVPRPRRRLAAGEPLHGVGKG